MHKSAFIPIAIALLLIGLSSLIQAKTISGRIRTVCWVADTIWMQIQDLKNPAFPSRNEIFNPIVNFTDCEVVRDYIENHHMKYLRSISGSVFKVTPCDYVNVDFCCLEIAAIVVPDDSAFADVPYIDLGDGKRKYEVISISCRP